MAYKRMIILSLEIIYGTFEKRDDGFKIENTKERRDSKNEVFSFVSSYKNN